MVATQIYPNTVAAVLKTETRGTRRVVVAVVLTDTKTATSAGASAGALPLRTVSVPTAGAVCRVEELALTDITVLGKNRIKLDLPNNRDKPDARELAAITQQLLQVAQDSTNGTQSGFFDRRRSRAPP